MASYVYLITNIITQKHYIGKSDNPNARWSRHKSNAKTYNGYFYNALRKYSTKNFTFEILKKCQNEEEAYEYERVLIELFQLRNRKYGYNIIEGGSGGSKGYKVKEKLKKYFSEKYMGSKSVRAKYCNDDIIKILNEYSTGKYTSEELAIRYGCSKSTMIRIITGESYSNVLYDRTRFDELFKEIKRVRTIKGINVKTAKLSDEHVKDIRNMYSSGKYSYQDLAKKFGVTKTNIYYIVNHKSRRNNEN